MQISIKTIDNLTVSVDLPEDENSDVVVTCNDLMLAAYQAIEHVFGHSATVRAYYETDPYDGILREPDDPVLQLMPEDVKPSFGNRFCRKKG